jgi:hypothetical protein
MFLVGLEYYVTARSAWNHNHNQVAGNLFHHGFEMMLKGILFWRSIHMPDVLKRHRHNLPWFWTEAQPALGFDGSRFDSFIHDLHRWELVRFGDFPQGKPKILQVIAIRAAMVIPVIAGHDEYRLCLEDADELFQLLTREMGWPANVVRARIGDPAMDDYLFQNNHRV